jgi:hypothetical protein
MESELVSKEIVDPPTTSYAKLVTPSGFSAPSVSVTFQQPSDTFTEPSDPVTEVDDVDASE